ncbi:hypothetical protein BCR44DRAFT_36286 [Catenaria anguillulae PL171]|uniref:Uncharacterized protein n=1 Tax=Catenaria anguillulae PL171 TaxID=765915 RepID=A0A1Y2HRG1_9FUNG|nr:hypothetical protein BCR44DRAFT_36286 [Catenaria anguillulae PL171]
MTETSSGDCGDGDCSTATDSAMVSSSSSSSSSSLSLSNGQVVHTFINPSPVHASLAQQHIDALVALLPQVALQFPEMGNPNLVLHPLCPSASTRTNPDSPTSCSPFPSYFPPPAHFHRGHTSLRLSLPIPLARTHRIHLYAVGNLIIDGRKYRVQGWLVRTSTLGVRAAEVLVSIDQPVMLVAKIEARTSTRELDYLEGELAVGKLGIVPSGWWRIYAVVAHGPECAISISPPTPRFHLSVADDWEMSTDGISVVSLADLVAYHNPHQIASAAAAAAATASPLARAATKPLAHPCFPLTTTSRTAPVSTLTSTSTQAAAAPPRAPSTLASAIGYLTGAFTSRPMSRSGSTPCLVAGTSVSRPMSSQKQDEDENADDQGSGIPGSFSYGLQDDNNVEMEEDDQSRPVSAGPGAEMKPLRFAPLSSRLDSRVPVVQGIVQDSW